MRLSRGCWWGPSPINSNLHLFAVCFEHVGVRHHGGARHDGLHRPEIFAQAPGPLRPRQEGEEEEEEEKKEEGSVRNTNSTSSIQKNKIRPLAANTQSERAGEPP